jgi:hypothetical protein
MMKEILFVMSQARMPAIHPHGSRDLKEKECGRQEI